jgi:hypothetical protein
MINKNRAIFRHNMPGQHGILTVSQEKKQWLEYKMQRQNQGKMNLPGNSISSLIYQPVYRE